MSKQYLSIEQMLHLKELGVDTSKATFYVNPCHPDKHTFSLGAYNSLMRFSFTKEPVFTLQDILDLLPKKLENRHEEYELTFFYSLESHDWKVQYLNDNVSFMSYRGGYELIDVAYEMLCWCANSGYIKDIIPNTED